MSPAGGRLRPVPGAAGLSGRGGGAGAASPWRRAAGAAGLGGALALGLAGAGQFILDVLGGQVQLANFVMGGVAGILCGVLYLLFGRVHAGIVPVGAVEPDRGGAEGDAD